VSTIARIIWWRDGLLLTALQVLTLAATAAVALAHPTTVHLIVFGVWLGIVAMRTLELHGLLAADDCDECEIVVHCYITAEDDPGDGRTVGL